MEIRHKPRRIRSKAPWAVLASVVSFLLIWLAFYLVKHQSESAHAHAQSWSTTQLSPLAAPASPGTRTRTRTRSKVFYPVSDQQTADKLQQDLRNCALADPIPLDPKNPPDFLSSCPGVSERLKILISPSSQQPHLAMELLKYCALSIHGGSAYIDSESPLMVSLDLLLAKRRNVAILNDSFLPRTIHGSFLWLQDTSVAKDMLQILVTTNLQVLESSPLLLSKSLYDLLAARAGVGKLSAGPNGDWYLWQHSCTVDPLGGRQVTAPISNYALQSYR
jgi:hypothetical protein